MLCNENQRETDILTIESPCTLTKAFIMRHLNKRANINGKNSYHGKSVLTIATQGYIEQHCDLDMIYYLLARGADPFIQDNNGNSMFSIATKNINKRLLKVITDYIVSKRDIISPNCKIQGIQGKAAMHIIAQLGTISQFLVLLKMNGKIDIDDDRGNAPLDIIASGINESFLDISKEEALEKLKVIGKNLKHYPSVTENQLLELKICIKGLQDTIDIPERTVNTSKNQKSYNQDATNKLISLCCRCIFNKKKIMQLIEEGADINGFARKSRIIHTNDRSPFVGKPLIDRTCVIYC